MNLKYYLLLPPLINHCNVFHNNNNENSKTEKTIPKPIKQINSIYYNIMSEIKSFINGNKSLPTEIKSKIVELFKENDILDDQKKTLTDIKNNLNNKDELKR